MEELDSVITVAWGSNDTVYFSDGSREVTQWNTAESSIEKSVEYWLHEYVYCIIHYYNVIA